MRKCLLILSLVVLSGHSRAIFAKMAENCPLAPAPTYVNSDFSPASRDAFHVRLKNGLTFSLSSQAPTAEGQEQFAKLSSAEQDLFFQRRHEVLQLVAQRLAFPHKMGYLKWVAGKISTCVRQVKSFFKKDDAVSPAEEITQALAPQLGGSSHIEKLGYQAIAEMLQAFDALLWQDFNVICHSQATSWNFFAGVAGGASIRRFGKYALEGVEIDVGYDYQNNSRFIRVSGLRQRLNDSVYVLEAMIQGGVFREFQLDPNAPTDEFTNIMLPPGFVYRRGKNSVAVGFVSGVNVADIAGIALWANGHSALEGGTLMAVARGLSTFSTYWTNAKKTRWWQRRLKNKVCERALMKSITLR